MWKGKKICNLGFVIRSKKGIELEISWEVGAELRCCIFEGQEPEDNSEDKARIVGASKPISKYSLLALATDGTIA